MTRIKQFLSDYRVAILALVLIILLICAGLYFSIDKSAVVLPLLILGVLEHAFAARIAWIGFVPLVGPMIAQVLSLPFLWLINGVGYVASIIAIECGYTKDVLATGSLPSRCCSALGTDRIWGNRSDTYNHVENT